MVYTPYKFTGKEEDPETGLIYFGTRYYDDAVGIWHGVDPLAEKMPGYSPYCYTMNNPIIMIDPDGREPWPVGPGNYSASVNLRYIGFGLRHPFASSRIGFGVTPGATNISTNSTRFATRGEVLHGSKRGQEDRGSENGAFRHALWQSTITSEFGSKTATEAGNAHEENPNAYTSYTLHETLDEADQTVDLLNNQIGRNIGEQNKDLDMLGLAFKVLDEFKNNGLFTASKDKDGNYQISKTKLSQEKYDKLKSLFNTLNENGRTKAEQDKIDMKQIMNSLH